MDQEQLDALANAALEELARRNYGDFFYLSHGKQWDLLRHQKYITDRLQKIIDGSKSIILSKYLPNTVNLL